jgi:hypothetical protein
MQWAKEQWLRRGWQPAPVLVASVPSRFLERAAWVEKSVCVQLKHHRCTSLRYGTDGNMLRPVILATWEARIRRITVQDQPRRKFARPSSQPIKNWVRWCALSYGIYNREA